MYFGSQKRDPCKNFYMVPNEIMRLGLSVGEIAVYNYLMYCEVCSVVIRHFSSRLLTYFITVLRVRPKASPIFL